MRPERYRQVKEIFAAAVARGPDSRVRLLERACGGDAELRAEVESLLAHDEAAGSFIDESAFDVAARAMAGGESGAPEGRRVGPYRILRELGRGGMGVVYLTERDDERFRQRVAVKVVKRGLETEDILRRFRNERQILASLNHPNIARLFDGGETEDGLPYFVMEYVEGLPLLHYCDEQDLSTRARLELFRTVCAAVQHAHQNLVVHRDLKPSNILVTGGATVKLLDFGVAKLLNPDRAGAALTETRWGRAMTPEYASPEQVRGERVTTATDVYSLGVVLYELLTGARPYGLGDDASQAAISSAICDSEPTRPSDAAAGGRKGAPRPPAATRDPKALRGDLDNIVLKAIKKDPAERYKSVEQFSEDLRRHLEGLPVLARGDTFAYRASKFVGRNRFGVAAACLIFFTLLGGIVATTWQARRAREQARIADAKSAEARAALARAEKINRFMQSFFSYANPQWFGRAGGRRDVSVLEAMRDIEQHIDDDFRDEPDVRADVYQQVGDSYRTQELHGDAERNLRKALALRLELYGEESGKTAESMYILGGVRLQQGDIAEHERLLTRALSIQRRHPEEGNNLPYMIADYACLLRDLKNDYAGALALYREDLDIFRRRYGESHYMISVTQLSLVQTSLAFGDYAQAEASAAGSLNSPPPYSFYFLNYLAWLQANKGDYRAAEETLRQATALARSRGAKPDMVPNVLNVQSFMAYRRGDYAQAVSYAEQAFAAQANDGGRYSRALLVALGLNKLGRAARAETLLREELGRLGQSERAFDLAVLRSALGESLTAQRRFAEAETLLLAAYDAQKARVLPQQYDLGQTRRRLAELYRAWGRADEARNYE